MIIGFRIQHDYSKPAVPYPACFVFPSFVACAYGVIVTTEGLLSYYLGRAHSKLVSSVEVFVD